MESVEILGIGVDNLHLEVYSNILVVFNPWNADYLLLIANAKSFDPLM